MEDVLGAASKLNSDGNFCPPRTEAEQELISSGYSPGLCSQMRLLEYDDHFIIEPTDSKVYPFLVISRSEGKLQLLDVMPQLNGQQLLRSSTIYGVLGVLTLLAGSYVLVITERLHAGTYKEKAVYLVQSMQFLFCNSSLGTLTPQEKKDEAHFVSLLRTVERTPGLFFSYDTDLTLSLQRANSFIEVRRSQPLWKQADPRFLWNHYISEDLIENKVHAAFTAFIFCLVASVSEGQVSQSLKLVQATSMRCNHRYCILRCGWTLKEVDVIVDTVS
ncbi:hypothetical protein GOP47_0015520 [Adiantum capillus-veneris]|uniref:SAC domain-containing protein n=1 Tax=Adiantum capillus-veneris TaxID=13818 RepID=A0A9D4ZBQ8_ADICA|nr:hypothetical protein GOP47_0015520 [Adiantum capillus-veneris]